MSLNRREFLRTASLGGGAAAALGGLSLGRVTRGFAQVLPKPSGKRLVIIGAGFGGNHAALTVRKLARDAEVVLLDRAPFFVSCPATIEYVFGLNSLDTITFGYSPLIAKGVKVIRTEIVGIEPDRKRVIGAQGAIEYDYLLVAALWCLRGLSDARAKESWFTAPFTMQRPNQTGAELSSAKNLIFPNLESLRAEARHRWPAW